MYFGVLGILFVLSIIEMYKPTYKKAIFYICNILLSLFLCLRYGQGSDYYGYMSNYYNADYHSEIGFRLIENILSGIGLPYILFIALIAIFQMICISRFIYKYSPYVALSFACFFHTIYLTYCFSGMRQGIVIAVFLGIMVELIIKKRLILYLLVTLLLSTIHSCALILLPLYFMMFLGEKILTILVFTAGLLGGILSLCPSGIFTIFNIGALQYYIDSRSISVIGLAERLFMFAVITILYFMNKKDREIELDSDISTLYKIYLYSMIVSLVFVSWSIMSSRLGIMEKAVEIVLIPILIKDKKIIRKMIFVILWLYILVMTFKNLITYMHQREGVYSGYNPFDYKYTTIFQIEETNQLYYDDYLNYLERIE